MIKINKRTLRSPGTDEERFHCSIRTAAAQFGLDPADLYLASCSGLDDAVRRVQNPESGQDRDYTLRAFPEWVRREANRARGKP